MTDLNPSRTNSNPIRVLLLDNHALVREGLRLLLTAHPRFTVVGEAGTSEAALALVKQVYPDVILMELNLDGELNAEVIPEVIAAARQSKIILVTGIEDVQIHHMAVQMGAMGVVRKSQTKGVLLKAIEKVHQGEVWIDRMMMADVLTNMARARMGQQVDPEMEKIAMLSEREREVIQLVGEGLKNKEVAERLSISETTVRHHLTSVYNKLQVSDRLELTIYAYRHGLAELPL